MKERLVNRWFQKTFIVIFGAFAIAMLAVVVLAYARTSGSTGIDVAKMYEMRKEIVQDSKIHEKKQTE